MSTPRVFVAFVVMLSAGCALPVQREWYFVAPAANSASGNIIAEVQRFALSAGYHRVGTSSPSPQLVAMFVRDPFAIRVLHAHAAYQIMASVRGYSDHNDALAERLRLYAALKARGVKVHLAQERYTDMVDILPYAP